MSAPATAAQTASANAVIDEKLLERQAGQRLELILAERAERERREAIYRTPEEEDQALSMRTPMTPPQAYGMLGLMLGAFAPAAYFTTIFNYGAGVNQEVWLIGMLVTMNFIAAGAGYKMGSNLGAAMQKYERGGLYRMLLASCMLGLSWAVVTGFAGGVIFLGVGGFFGAIFAAPVGIAAFMLFALIHRAMESGTLMERSHVLPAAAGVALTISAFILSFKTDW
jgi:hypothetical protein